MEGCFVRHQFFACQPHHLLPRPRNSLVTRLCRVKRQYLRAKKPLLTEERSHHILSPSRLRPTLMKSPPEVLSLGRNLVLYSFYFIFGVCLIYASGLPFLVCSIAQQTGHLPRSVSGSQLFYSFMFPLGVPNQISDASVDLLGVAYLSISIPFFVACILLENFIIFIILPPSNRPPHTARFADSICSVGLGVLQVLAARILFLQWMEPLYTLIYDNLKVTSALSDSTKPFTWWACLLIADFLYYWFHRLSHTISWMWTTHAVHHSSEEVSLRVAIFLHSLPYNSLPCN